MLRFPPKKILVPFDLTDASMGAWRQAEALAARNEASLEVVYAEKPPPPTEWPMLQWRAFNADLRRKVLRRIRSKIGASPKVLVFEGDPVVTILRLARTRKPDLIVMGTHGRTGFERVLMSSVAESVVRHSPVPVLVVHGKPKPLRSVLAPVNLSDYSEHGFFYAAGAAAALQARLTVLHVVADPLNHPHPKMELDRLVGRLPRGVREACDPTVEITGGRPAQAILSAGARHGLIVLVAHRKTLLKDAVLGTTAERVLRHSRVPVLAVPASRMASYGRAGSPRFELPAPV